MKVKIVKCLGEKDKHLLDSSRNHRCSAGKEEKKKRKTNLQNTQLASNRSNPKSHSLLVKTGFSQQNIKIWKDKREKESTKEQKRVSV